MPLANTQITKGGQNVKRLLFWTVLVSVILVIAVLSSLPFLIRSDSLEGFINRLIKEQTTYTTTFDRIRISFFPTPVVHVDNVQMTPQEGANLPLIRAERTSFRPSIFSLLIGRPALAHAAVKGADIHYTWRDPDFVKTISLKDSSLDLWNIASNKPIRFKVKGKFLSDSENINVSGTVRSHFEHFKIKDLSSKIQVRVDPIELNRFVEWWGTPLPFHVDQGTFSLSAQATKVEGTSNVEVKGSGGLDKLVYQIPPKVLATVPGNYNLQFNTSLDLDTGNLDIKEGSLTAPFGGPFELDGSFNIFTGSMNEVLVKTQSLQLQILPQYVLSLEKVLPVNLGFSGETQLDFYLKGEPELFLVNLSVDLTNTNLTYSKFFSKPTGIPLSFKSDMKLAAGRALRGDFSLDFEEASLKGSLVGLDLVSGEGEMTILTNKFSIDDWQKYSPLLRQFELSGGIKVLTSIKGNLNRLDEARIMNNFSLDSLQARSANGFEIKNLSGSLDSGPLDSEFRDLKFEIGNNIFLIEGKTFQQPQTRTLLLVQAPTIDIADLTSQVRKAAEAIDMETKMDWNPIENSVRQFFSPTETVEQFEAQLILTGKHFLIPEFKFLVFGGSVSGRAALDQSQEIPSSFLEMDIQRLSLSRMQSSSTQPPLLGNLFAHVSLTNQSLFDEGWLGRLKGGGSVSITNGELHTVDLLGGLGQIAQLAPLDSFRSGVTRFDDIRGDFEILGQKIITQNTLMVSEDFQVEGQGEVNFEGILNFRLSVYLSPALSQRISPRLGENVRLGPIPVLIVGHVSKPQVRQDPLLISSFLQSLVQEQFSKITSGFLPPSRQNPTSEPSQPDSSTEQSQESKNLDQQLIQSGFNLLESFLSEKKSSS